jgi:general L-amino acid transport system substrate-binding protein
MSLNHVSAIGLAVMLLLTGCMGSDDLEELTEVSGENILGCTYSLADNFQSNATVDDGSCLFEDSLEAEYDEGYDDGYDDGSLGNDYYWDCPDSATAISMTGSYQEDDGLAGISADALDDFTEESFEAAWLEQPGSPDWCGTEFNYDSLELGESVVPAIEDEVPEYFLWYEEGFGAKSDRYYWDDYYTEDECEEYFDGVWKSINGHGFCGEYLEWETDRDANLVYEQFSGYTWWGKYEIIGDYMYLGWASPLPNEFYDDGYDAGYIEGYDYGFSDGYDDGLMNGYSDGHDDGLMWGYSDGFSDGYEDGLMDGGYGSTLDAILDRGYMMCGVKGSQYGMGYQEEDGTYSGLDIEYCRAIAAAIGLDPDEDVEYILASGSNRFELLAYEEIDVLIRTSTWTTSRDTDLDADFAGINFYDGQGILINTDAYATAPTSALDLDGAKICVGIGTTTEGNIADYFAVNNMEYTAVNSDDASVARQNFENGECDAWTGDMSAMVAMKWFMIQDGSADFEMAIMPELLSKEPLAAATRDYDTEWNEVVSWVWYGMLTAEELGINSGNYEEAAADCEGEWDDVYVCRLLTMNFGLGTSTNPLPHDWMQSVLATTGNYYEAYDTAFCDGDGQMSNCLIDRAGTANAPWWEGGLQYAPPMR